MRNARLGFRQAEETHLEIDFIANLGSKRYYIQEKISLINIGDAFKKIIIVKNVVNVTRDEEGITTMSIYDFLLKENSLEL